MEDKKTDRRVKYTKMVITESLVRLLKQKPISKITIKEICEDADVNRATFYAHYQDQYDLLHQIENDVIRDINRYLSDYDFTDRPEAMTQMLERILEYVKANAELFDLLLNSNGDIQFLQEITKVLGQQTLLPAAVSQSLSQPDAEYVFLFFANGCIGVIKKWLRDGLEKPARDTAELILRIMIEGRNSFIEH